MRASLFVSSEPILYNKTKPSTLEGYDSEETLHPCEDKHPSSSSIKYEPLPACAYHVDLDHVQGPAMIFHDESLEMENPWDIESCETSTLDSKGMDSTYKHGS